MGDFLKIDLGDTSKLHEDIILKIPSLGIKIVADSYYLVLDNSMDESDYEEGKLLAVLVSILGQWKFKIEKLENSGVCFLPFDFSDQYIGCFRFEGIKNRLCSSYGFTEKITGWMISPSKLEQFEIDESDYSVTYEIFDVDRWELLASLDDCLVKFGT